MSTLAAEVPYELSFTDSSTSLDRVAPFPYPTTVWETSYLSFEPSLIDLPYHPRHVRSSSKASSIHSSASTIDSVESIATRVTTPPRTSPAPMRQHGPLLLPKMRPQDREIEQHPIQGPKIMASRRTISKQNNKPKRSSHARSQTNPETLNGMALAHMSSFDSPVTGPSSLDYVDGTFYQPFGLSEGIPAIRRASTCPTLDHTGLERYNNYLGCQPMLPFNMPSSAYGFDTQSQLGYHDAGRSASPLSIESTPEPTPSTTLMSFLTTANPAVSLVRSVSFPLRDPSIKHFWWDVRKVTDWKDFNISTILNLPGAADLLTTPVPAPLLPQPGPTNRHPENEQALHSTFASYYLPKLNSALSISSGRPLRFSVPSNLSKDPKEKQELLFVANAANDDSTAAAMFGGKPTARVVGIVRSFDRFNTGMRNEGNIKRVEYLRGLAAIHHAMREYSCRYGFIVTEIELIIVRNGTERTPFFGELDVTSFEWASSVSEGQNMSFHSEAVPLTACLALWGLCQIAGDNTGVSGQAHFKSEIGAPAEGTRRKARARESWIPLPQVVEQRQAKRSRGWTWPEEAIGKREVGRRGVKYTAC